MCARRGHTSRAGYVLVGSATRGGITVISAVLGDPSEAARDVDSLALLRYGFLIDQGQGGAPEDVVLGDRLLLALGAIWTALFALGVYR